MKVLVLFFLLLLTGCGVFRPFSENIAVFQDRVTQEEFDAWAESLRGSDVIDTAWKLNRWGLENMSYTPDGIVDYPKSHLVTLKRREGDCDDYSYMYFAALTRLGYSPVWLLSVHSSTRGHAVCLFQTGAGYWHTSNWPNVYGPFATIDDAASSIYPDWVKWKRRDWDLRVVDGGER